MSLAKYEINFRPKQAWEVKGKVNYEIIGPGFSHLHPKNAKGKNYKQDHAQTGELWYLKSEIDAHEDDKITAVNDEDM